MTWQGTEEEEVDLEVQKVLDEVASGVMSTVPMQPTQASTSAHKPVVKQGAARVLHNPQSNHPCLLSTAQA